MKKVLGVRAATLLLVGGVLFALPATRGQARASNGDNLFEFERLVAVFGAFLGSTDLRGVQGAGAPWVLEEGEARLKENGELKVEVEGLVLDPAIPPDSLPPGITPGTNPVAEFFATLSCLDADNNVVNIDTAPAAATPEGDATIKDTLELPDTCVAPLVFVRGVAPAFNDPWFAVSGF